MSHWTGVKRAKASVSPALAGFSHGIRRLLPGSSKDFSPQGEGMGLRVADEPLKLKPIYAASSNNSMVVEAAGYPTKDVIVKVPEILAAPLRFAEPECPCKLCLTTWKDGKPSKNLAGKKQ
jgi:hypothetical protein